LPNIKKRTRSSL